MSSIKYKGFLEFVTVQKIYGWLYNEDNPTSECLVDLYIDGRCLGVYPCNEYHQSLVQPAGRNGHVVFSIPTPKDVLTDQSVVVDVKIHGTGVSLPGSPIHTSLYRATIDTALSGMNSAKSNLCHTGIVESLNRTRRPVVGGAPEPALRPSPWFADRGGVAPEYFAHQLFRLNAQNDFHFDDDMADFVAVRGADFGVSDHAVVPLARDDAHRLTEGYVNEDGLFVSRLFQSYARTRPAEWRALPESRRLYQFIHWAVGQVRLPVSAVAPAHIERLNTPTAFGFSPFFLSKLYIEAYEQDEPLRTCCDPANERDTFVIALMVTLWLIRWNLDECFVPETIRRILRMPVQHDGTMLTGLSYFCLRLGIPNANTLTLDAFEERRKPRRIERTEERGINVFGYLNGYTALGWNAQMSLAALKETGFAVAIPPTVLPGHQDVERLHSVNLLHFGVIGAPTDMLNHGFDRFRNAYNIGLLVWETSVLPASGRLALELLDEIWTPSHYCAAIFRQHFAGPIEVIPHGLVLPPVSGTPGKRPEDAPFRFFFCFDELSWYTRKNPAAIVSAFRRAFPPRDNVELVIKIRPASRNGAATALSMRSISNIRDHRRFRRLVEGDPRVRVVMSESDAAGILQLMDSCDCYVSLHRSEGFGYTMAEAMMLGKPVIASNYSGNLEYMNSETAFLVDGREYYMEHDEYIGVMPGASWFEPDIEHAAATMRLVHQDAAERSRRAKAGARHVERHLSLDAMRFRYAQRLNAIWSLRSQTD